MDNVVLIGFMGSGKTEVGRLLAKSLGMKFVDTDSLIEEKEGRKISDIFAEDGEDKFRDMESALIGKLSGSKKLVISTGGGMILRPANIKKLKELGPLVLLWADKDTVHKRLKGVNDRPLLKADDQKKRISEILDFRTPIYKGAADIEVDTSKLTPEESSRKILSILKKAVK